MYKELPKLVMFRELGQDSVITRLSEIIREFDSGKYDKTDLIGEIYEQIHELLKIATDYGFDKNLWQDYITFVIVTNENPFSLTCERQGISNGSCNGFAVSDMKVFNRLFGYDFSRLEEALGVDCFSIITNYTSIQKRKQIYNRSVSERVRELSDRIRDNLEKAADETSAAEGTLELVTAFYRDYGVGMIGLNKAFRIGDGTVLVRKW